MEELNKMLNLKPKELQYVDKIEIIMRHHESEIHQNKHVIIKLKACDRLEKELKRAEIPDAIKMVNTEMSRRRNIVVKALDENRPAHAVIEESWQFVYEIAFRFNA